MFQIGDRLQFVGAHLLARVKIFHPDSEMGVAFVGLCFQGGVLSGIETNDACALSRLNSAKQSRSGKPVALSPREMKEASTCNDADLSQVKGCVRAVWERCTVSLNVHIKDDSELCIYGEILLQGTRIVVPKAFRNKVVRLAHEVHQSIVETKYRLHSKVWWPIMHRDEEQLCKVCHGCHG